MVAQAAPLVITPGVVVFGSVVAFAFLYTFDKAFRALFAPLMHRVGNTGFGGIYGHGAVKPLKFVSDWADDVEGWTKNQMRACERAMSWGIQTMRFQLSLIAETAGSMAHNYALAFDQVWHGIKHAVPHIVRQTIVRPVQKAATYSDAKLRARVGALAHAVASLNAKVGHLTHATAGAIAAPFPRIGHLEREVVNELKGLRRFKWLAKYGTIAALGAAVLAKLGVSYARCTRSKKFGNKLCKSNADWMDDFFLGTALLLSSYSFKDFVKEGQAGFDLGLEGLQLFIREFKNLDIPKS